MTKVFFKNIQNEILSALDKTERSLHIALAWFTNDILFDAIMRLLDKGISINLVLMHDEINCNPSALEFQKFIAKGGSLFFVNERLMHNKFCIIDSKVVITGSYNWTYSAEYSNIENVTLINDEFVASQFIEQFNVIIRNCEECKEYKHIENLSNVTDIQRKFLEKEREIKSVNKLSYVTVQPPKLKDTYDNEPSSHRLCNISIGTIFRGPQKGKKYIHAEYCCSSIHCSDDWVDIIDDDFVNDVRQYFHKNEGGLIDNNLPLRPIPKEIYDFKKYKFKRVGCSFKKGNHTKLATNEDRIIYTKKGSPYLYNKFDTLIRYEGKSDNYPVYNSMHELCRLICKSVFASDVSDDIAIVSDSDWGRSGIYKLSGEDDIYDIKPIYSRNYAPDTIDSYLRKRLLDKSKCFWVNKKPFCTSVNNVLFCEYSNDKYTSTIYVEKAEWLIIRDFLYYKEYDNDPYQFIKSLKSIVKEEGIKGLVIRSEIVAKKLNWKELGFREYSPYGDYLICDIS